MTHNIKIVYLAGPMTGLPNFNYDKFNALARSIRARGFICHNPAEAFGGDQGMDRIDYVAKDFELVCQSHAVAVMRGWENSPGARFETAQAKLIDIPVLDAEVLALSGTCVSINTDKFGAPLPESHVQTAHSENKVLDFWDTKLNAQREERVKDTPFKAVNTPRLTLLDVARDHEERVRSVTDFAGVIDGGGYKSSMDNPAKLPLWLVPNALVQATARALQHGAKKYAPNNWRRGMKYSEVYSALQRHLSAWLEGEDNDKDSGLNHLDHAGACLGFLTEYVAQPNYAKFDDRFKRPKPIEASTDRAYWFSQLAEDNNKLAAEHQAQAERQLEKVALK